MAKLVIGQKVRWYKYVLAITHAKPRIIDAIVIAVKVRIKIRAEGADHWVNRENISII